MNKYCSLLFYLIFHQIYFSQTIFDQGAISTSIVGANVAQSDLWSINNNIGGLSLIDNVQVGFSTNNRFLISDFTTSTVAFAIPYNNSAFGLNYSNYGNANYQIHCAGLGYSMQLGKNISGGLKVNYLNLNLGDFYGSKSIFSADLGLIAKLNSELKMGVVIKNPTLAKLADFEDERIPTSIQLGFDYAVSEQLNTIISIEKDISYASSIKAAIIYSPLEKLTIRAGVGTYPTTFGFGLGTQIKKINIDLGTQYHQILGFSPELSITTNLHK
jgi:hypothetical protein